MRDYKKELEWEKNNYKKFVVRIDNKTAEKFLAKLDEPFSAWAKKQIEKFLNEK